MKIYRILPEPVISLDQADSDFARDLAQWYLPRGEWSIRANIVSSPSGRLVGFDGASTSLTNPLDRALVGILRGQADAVIVGAETVRSEPVPVPANAPLVILSSRGDLDGQKIPSRSLREGGVIILTGPEPLGTPVDYFPAGVATHHVIGDSPTIHASQVKDVLHEQGYDRLLVEGGARTLERFLDASAVDELAMTLTGPPLVSSQPPLPWWRREWGEWKAALVATDSNRNLYFRFLAPQHSPS